MANSRWYFTKEEILNSPSRRCGIDAEKELRYRQQEAKLIHEMGQHLKVTHLVINTAIVYMHRFYMFHTFTRFHRNNIGPAAIFLAAKVEEQPRKLELVIKIAHYVSSPQASLDLQSEAYAEKAQELVVNENILLQTLGFDVAIDHPHTYVIKCFEMVSSKSPYNDRMSSLATTDLARTSYHMATQSLQMTTMCIQYKPAVVACVCIYLACKWSNSQIQGFSEGRDWYCHLDPTVTLEMLENLTSDFLTVFEKCPNLLKKKIIEERSSRHSSSLTGMRSSSLTSANTRGHNLAESKNSAAKLPLQNAVPKTVLTHKEYSEKREKERREKEKEKERADHREKHLSSSMIQGHRQQPPTSNLVIPTSHHPNVPQQQRVQTREEAVQNIRKTHSEPHRQGSHTMANRGGMAFPQQNQHVYKESMIKREVPIKSEDKMGEKHDRTSDYNKLVSDKYVKHTIDNRQYYNVKNSENKERKIEHKVELKQPDLVKVEIKPDPVREVKNKSEFKLLENDSVKCESSVTNKLEVKESVKVEPTQDIKSSNNSFIFNNSFSLRDFLNPSEMPPEDIFDTEIDSKQNDFDEYLAPSPTRHAKLKSPPKPTNNLLPHPPSVTTSTGQKLASSDKQGHYPIHSAYNSDSNTAESKEDIHHSSFHHQNYDTEKSSSLIIHNLKTPTPTKRKKEKSQSPIVVKSKIPNAYAEPKVVLTNITPEEVKQHTKGHVPAAYKDVLQGGPRDGEGIRSNHAVTTKNVSSSVMVSSNGNVVSLNNQPKVLFPPISVPDLVNSAEKGLKVTLNLPEKCATNSLTTTTPITSTVLTTACLPSVHKKHKHSHHKHKEKKKHKHKEKDKHKDRELKEHKKNKKHKKHKEKNKNKEKVKDDINPPKIILKLEKEKGIYTPESTPIKLKITKSRLQSNTSISTPVSPSRDLADNEITTKVKLKIPKNKGETESRKREASPTENLYHAAKMQRTSSHNAPQVGASIISHPSDNLSKPSYGKSINPQNSGFSQQLSTSKQSSSQYFPVSNPSSFQNLTASKPASTHQLSVSNPVSSQHISISNTDSPQHLPVLPYNFSTPICNRPTSIPHQRMTYPQNSNFPQAIPQPINRHSYPIAMNNYSPFVRPALPSSTVTNSSFMQSGAGHFDQYMASFFAPSSYLSAHNVSFQHPPPHYQDNIFNVPPPGYLPHQPQTSANPPPLPAEPPPVKPPTPPPE